MRKEKENKFSGEKRERKKGKEEGRGGEKE